jgi:hypothetical protein
MEIEIFHKLTIFARIRIERLGIEVTRTLDDGGF